MRTMLIEVLSDAANAWVVTTPGRRFPGIVVQGDSLQHLQYLAKQIFELAQSGDREELLGCAEELNELLTGRLEQYRAAVEQSTQ